MPVSLTEALQTTRYDLGANFEKLGKKEGIFGSKILLANNEKNGWSVCKLDWPELLVRWAFGFFGAYKSTHLSRVEDKIIKDYLQGEWTQKEHIDPNLVKRIVDLYNKDHPREIQHIVPAIQPKPSLRIVPATEEAKQGMLAWLRTLENDDKFSNLEKKKIATISEFLSKKEPRELHQDMYQIFVGTHRIEQLLNCLQTFLDETAFKELNDSLNLIQ